MKPKNKITQNNNKATYNAYVNGVSVSFMATMVNQTESAIYKSINRHKKTLLNPNI